MHKKQVRNFYQGYFEKSNINFIHVNVYIHVSLRFPYTFPIDCPKTQLSSQCLSTESTAKTASYTQYNLHVIAERLSARQIILQCVRICKMYIIHVYYIRYRPGASQRDNRNSRMHARAHAG